MNDITLMYKALLDRKVALDSLTDYEKNELFSYLCDELEKGNPVDDDILHFCTGVTGLCPSTECEKITESVYSKLNGMLVKNKRAFRKCFFRRISAAMIAVFSLVVFSFITVSAFSPNFVEHIKTIFYEEKPEESKPRPTETIFFEHFDKAPKAYETAEKLFESELSDYYYPSRLPEGVHPFSVTVKRNEKAYFVYKLKDDNRKTWSITASPAKGSYMPMGYTYETATTDGLELTFVYTLSRNSGGITGYTAYVRLENTMYTLVFPASDWDSVLIILDSFSPAKQH